MRSSLVVRFIVLFTILTLPIMAHAQEEAVVSGRVTDSSGGVLPGVTVRAVHEATGNAFEAVTDERGAYRMSVRVGAFRMTAQLPGFNTSARAVELLLGQTAVVNLQMSPAGVAETVTVTGEAPLIETTTSTLGGNIDPRQVSELPANGRNWVGLAMLAPGSRINPLARRRGSSRGSLNSSGTLPSSSPRTSSSVIIPTTSLFVSMTSAWWLRRSRRNASNRSALSSAGTRRICLASVSNRPGSRRSRKCVTTSFVCRMPVTSSSEPR